MEDEQARTGKMGKSVSSLKRTVVAVCAVVSAGLVGTVVGGPVFGRPWQCCPSGPDNHQCWQRPQQTTCYSSLVSPLPGNVPSLGVESDYYDELGNEVNLASSGTLSSVVVTMSSFTCETGSGTTCVTTHGTTYPVPITLNIYNPGLTSTPGTLIASDTQTFNIPYRPSADNTICGNTGQWFNSTNETCYNGFATNITFDASNFTPVNPTLPGTLIYGIAYNTETNGYDPLGRN